MIQTASKYKDESTLIASLRGKEKAALEYLYDHYNAALYGVILRIVGDEGVGEEVLQDIFLKIWDRFESYDPTKGKLFTWMVNIARNHAIDKLRSKEISREKKTSRIDSSVDKIDRTEKIEQQTEAIGIADCMRTLPEEQRFIVEYLYLKGYSQSEVAEEFGIPLGTVKTRLRLAMQTLRLTLGVK